MSSLPKVGSLNQSMQLPFLFHRGSFELSSRGFLDGAPFTSQPGPEYGHGQSHWNSPRGTCTRMARVLLDS